MNKILLSINYVDYKKKNKRKWQEKALDVLVRHKSPEVDLITFNFDGDVIDVPECFKVNSNLVRNSKHTIGNNREMPYVKEVFDKSAEMGYKIFGYMNSDILVKPSFFDIFSKDVDVYMFQRRDISDVDYKKFMKDDYHTVWAEHPGIDAIFFNTEWWEGHKNKFHDDLILGEPEWDYYYMKRVKKVTKNYIMKRSLYHVHHNTIWTLDSKGAINNRKINGTI